VQCQSVLRTSTQVNGKVGNSTARSWETPNQLSHKFAWMITSGPLTLCKISSWYGYPFSPSNMWKCELSDSASFLVLSSAYSQDPCTDFYNQYVRWRFAQRCAFWGSWKRNFTFQPPFSTQKTNIFDGTWKISRQKDLNICYAHL